MAEPSKAEALAAVKLWFATDAASKWNLRPEHVRVLAAVMKNLVQTEERLDVPHFRSKYRKLQSEVDWLASGNFLRQDTGPSPCYQLDFRGFVTLLGNGNSSAHQVRVMMDRILSAAKRRVQAYPRLTHMPLSDMRTTVNAEAEDRTFELAVDILSTSSVGIHAGGSPQEPTISFSDHIFNVRSVADYVLPYVRSFGGPQLLSPELQAPLSLTKLALVPDAYENAQRALKELLEHPSAALASAKSALEGAMKVIVGDDVSSESPRFPQLVSACRRTLRFEGEFEELGRRLSSVAEAIANLRNVYSSAHGKKPGQRGATQVEARLVVGTALLLSDYLLDRWEAQRTSGEL